MTPASILEHEGVSQSITEWALDYGITPAIIIARLERGMSITDAITTPMKVGYGRQRLVLPALEAFIHGEREVWRREHRMVKRRVKPQPIPRSNVVRTYTHNGRTLTVPQWADVLGVKVATLYFRLRSGWPVEKALAARDAEPPHIAQTEIARQRGLDPRTVQSRLRRGWALDDALTIEAGERMGRPRKQVPGVPSDFPPFEGTGAGSTAQETPNLSF